MTAVFTVLLPSRMYGTAIVLMWKMHGTERATWLEK